MSLSEEKMDEIHSGLEEKLAAVDRKVAVLEQQKKTIEMDLIAALGRQNASLEEANAKLAQDLKVATEEKQDIQSRYFIMRRSFRQTVRDRRDMETVVRGHTRYIQNSLNQTAAQMRIIDRQNRRIDELKGIVREQDNEIRAFKDFFGLNDDDDDHRDLPQGPQQPLYDSEIETYDAGQSSSGNDADESGGSGPE